MVTDVTQLLLTIVLIISTILLVVIGVQVISILKELKQILTRVNNVVDSVEKVGLSLDSGFKELGGFFMGFKALLRVVDVLARKKHDK